MSTLSATVVIPTLNAGPLLLDCLHSLQSQSRSDFQLLIVDNSGAGIVRRQTSLPPDQVIENQSNRGYGGAINQATQRSSAPYIFVLNDDATLHPNCLDAAIRAMDAAPSAGMGACRVHLADSPKLDSAGMLLCPDGSSKQRGQGHNPQCFATPGDTLFPSGAAAIYRRSMLLETGGFDENFFLYCEDTDLGLRAQWAGWSCLYIPSAEATHRYSATAGRVSPLKAYFVERNRLFVLIKNFPTGLLLQAPLATLQRYFWHLASLSSHSSSAGQFARQNSPFQLVSIVLRAHLATLRHLPRLLRQRAAIRRSARISPLDFARICRHHAISPKQVAAL